MKSIVIKPELEIIKQELENGICRVMEGKMEGMSSYSTSCLGNSFCQKNRTIEGSICQKCYAQSLLSHRTVLDIKCERNAGIITKEIFPLEVLPRTINCLYFRLEAFGDLRNIIQLTNYVNIAKVNPKTRFGLFTKNAKLLYEYFSKNPCPDNMNIMYSSLFINKPASVEKLLPLFKPGQLKVFTVYNYEYIKEHPELEINCGGRKCLDCCECYDKTKTVYINEILKADQEKAEALIAVREKGLENIFNKFSDFNID